MRLILAIVTVYRRIGGLEIRLTWNPNSESVYRRIGGLESGPGLLGEQAKVYRRIGGLETGQPNPP